MKKKKRYYLSKERHYLWVRFWLVLILLLIIDSHHFNQTHQNVQILENNNLYVYTVILVINVICVKGRTTSSSNIRQIQIDGRTKTTVAGTCKGSSNNGSKWFISVDRFVQRNLEARLGSNWTVNVSLSCLPAFLVTVGTRTRRPPARSFQSLKSQAPRSIGAN